MITLAELNKRKFPTTAIIDGNLNELCRRLNKVRAAWGRPMIITSGLRSETQQQDLIKAGKSNAPKSKHLLGLAADIQDPEHELYDFLAANPKLMEDVGIWCEDKSATLNWVHIQISPPGSGRRFFLP